MHVGAGFHNSSLYEALRASIGPLVALLGDEEDKTRANAAGALGNLVRNSGLLCRPLIEASALQVLLQPVSVAGAAWCVVNTSSDGIGNEHETMVCQCFPVNRRTCTGPAGRTELLT